MLCDDDELVKKEHRRVGSRPSPPAMSARSIIKGVTYVKRGPRTQCRDMHEGQKAKRQSSHMFENQSTEICSVAYASVEVETNDRKQHARSENLSKPEKLDKNT